MTIHSVTYLKEKLNISTLNLVLLSVATGGIYPLMWLYRHQDSIMEETGRPFSSRSLVIWMAVCFGLAAFLRPLFPVEVDQYGYGYDSSSETIAAIISLISFAGMVLFIVWSFKARAALQHYALTQFHFELKMNPAWTILFHVFYICYCINAMPEALAKHQIIHGKPDMPASSPDNTSE